MFHLTAQEKFVAVSFCVIIFVGTMVNIGLQKNLRFFDWLHTAQKKTLIKAIDLNHASVEDLLKVPGIGPKTAQFITEYRHTKGAFTSLEKLRDAWGMTPDRYERIIKYLKI